MRRIVFDVEADREFARQLDYLTSRHATKAAANLEERVRLFLLSHLANFPATGRRLEHRGLWET